MSPSILRACVVAPSSNARRAGLLLALSLMPIGCGERAKPRVPTFPVEVSLTFKGQPMPGAFVTLHPTSPPGEGVPTPRASVGGDGAVSVSTYDAGDGAPSGSYVVTVEWYKLVKSGGDVAPGPNVVPAKFASPSTSDLKIDIAEGENRLPPINL